MLKTVLHLCLIKTCDQLSFAVFYIVENYRYYIALYDDMKWAIGFAEYVRVMCMIIIILESDQDCAFFVYIE